MKEKKTHRLDNTIDIIILGVDGNRCIYYLLCMYNRSTLFVLQLYMGQISETDAYSRSHSSIECVIERERTHTHTHILYSVIINVKSTIEEHTMYEMCSPM